MQQALESAKDLDKAKIMIMDKDQESPAFLNHLL
jgi:hypothetical protein